MLNGRKMGWERFKATGIAALLISCILTCSANASEPASQATPISSELRQIDDWGQHARPAKTMLILFEIAALLAGAKLLGALAERFKVPGVIGELLAGVILGPYLLGGLISVPLHGHWSPLFPLPSGPEEWPINAVVWNIAQFASIILLFVTGLHTDFEQFLKYLRPAALVAVVGLILPFLLGITVTAFGPFADLARATPGESVLIPALFIGCILAATSIGITARVLGDIGKLDTPEGVTILGAAVMDDVLGIIALAIVVGIHQTHSVSAGNIALVAGKAFGFWIALTVAVLLLAGTIERILTRIRYAGAMVAVALALAFVCSGAAEGFGLAFIIGAYSVGLGLSRTKMARTLMTDLEPIGHFFIPIFFASLGMLVNPRALFSSWQVIAFGLTVTLAAIVGKVLGCGAAALPVGFNLRGGYRIGVGMMPRGEVALIVAGIGLSQKIIGEVVFGVSIMMTLITTVVAPLLLVPAFARGGSGRKQRVHAAGPGPEFKGLPGLSDLPPVSITLDRELAGIYIERLLSLAKAGGWEASYDDADRNLYLLRSQNDAASVRVEGPVVTIDSTDSRQPEFVAFAEAVRHSLVENAGNIAFVTSPPASPSS